MTRNRSLQILVAVFVALWILPGAFAASNEADTKMTIGIGITLDTLDPAQQTTTTVMNVLDYELQTLLTLNEKGELQPQLATSWAWSDDGKALTLELRKDVTFHDGTAFDAKAVKFSLGRLISGKV